MYVKAMVASCDFTDAKYDPPVEGAFLVSQGASGRWSTVLHMGPEEVVRQRIEVLSREDALVQIEAKGDGGWVEF